MTRPTSLIPFRILCLHDEESNAKALQRSLQILGDRLCQNHAIDLVYVNSPLVVLAKNDPNVSKESHDDDDPDSERRVWWWESNTEQQQQSNTSSKIGDDDNSNVNTTSLSDNNTPAVRSSDVESKNIATNKPELVRYCGLDASLMMLRQMWKSSPFWGIIGIGQGAAVASLFILTLLLPSAPSIVKDDEEVDDDDDDEILPPIEQLLPPPQLAIFIDGHSLLSETNTLIDDKQLHTLHLIRSPKTADENTTNCQNIYCNNELLVQQFGGTVHTMRTKGSNDQKLTKLHNTDLNFIGRFIIEQKTKLVGSRRLNNTQQQQQQQREIVALQTALHMVEMEASNVIADHVLKNPPSALMAVIRPQVVAGLDSNQKPRRPVGTGGAPCPVEFLQRKDKRYPPSSSTADGRENEESERYSTASRAHPRQDPT